MMERLAHFLTGWVEFEARGNGPRFLNAAARSGVEFWGFRREEGCLVLRGKARQYGCLRPLFRRCGIRPKLRCRGGLPFFIARLWRQKGLAVGSLLGVGVYLFLSGFCWGVTVTGAETLPDSQVLEVARQHGVSLGVSLKGLDAKAAALAIQNDLPGVTWLSINTGGCFVEISLRESVEAPEVVDDREWSNMVATRPGTILSIQAERGRPVVSPGDTVEAGQMLIAGLYEQEQDPYSPPPEDPYQILGAARGSVRALTYREFTVEVPQEKVVDSPTGQRWEAYSLVVFGLRIPLGLNTFPEEGVSQWKESTPWSPLGKDLPLVWEKTTYVSLEEERVLLEEEAWKEAALLQLRQLQREELPAGSKVVEEDLTYQFQDGVCVLTAQCRCEEEIGEVRKISVE